MQRDPVASSWNDVTEGTEEERWWKNRVSERIAEQELLAIPTPSMLQILIILIRFAPDVNGFLLVIYLDEILIIPCTRAGVPLYV